MACKEAIEITLDNFIIKYALKGKKLQKKNINFTVITEGVYKDGKDVSMQIWCGSNEGIYLLDPLSNDEIKLVFLLLGWLYLVKVAFPVSNVLSIDGGHSVIKKRLKELGPASDEEKIVLAVFLVVALAWITRSFVLQKFMPGIDDTVIAIVGALVLFVIPSTRKRGDYLLDWRTAENIPLGILLLFGGGLAVAAGFKDSGLADWIGQQLNLLEVVPYFVLLLAMVTMVNFLTEITSNVATASMLLPITATLALSIGVHPHGLIVAATVAASCAFMLPVATPPNAVVFGAGYLTILQHDSDRNLDEHDLYCVADADGLFRPANIVRS